MAGSRILVTWGSLLPQSQPEPKWTNSSRSLSKPGRASQTLAQCSCNGKVIVKHIAMFAAAMACFSAPSSSQLPPPAIQRPPRLPYGAAITLAQAKAVADTAAAAAAVARASVAIAIADPNGELILFEQLDDTSNGVREIAIAKARFAARFRMPTGYVAAQKRAGNDALLALPGADTGAGGVTLTREGHTIGGLGVSGMTGGGDEAVAEAGAAAVK